MPLDVHEGLGKANKKLEKIKKANIIFPSISPFAAPMVLSEKDMVVL